MKSVAIVATLDSKAAAAQFVAALVESAGAHPLLIDASCLRPPDIDADVTRDEVARAAGLSGAADLERLGRGDRVAVMGRGVGNILAERPIHGVIFLGGNQGAAIAAIATSAIPPDVPGVLGTTIPPPARGAAVERFLVIQLPADLTGPPNPVTAPALEQAVRALGLRPKPILLPATGPRGLVGISTLGNTEPTAMALAAHLEADGYTAVIFHASGPGGTTLESLAAEGRLAGVVDVAPHELVGEVLGEDLYRSERPRLEAHARLSARVFLPGSLDYYCVGTEETIPERLRQRPRVMHNPLNANVLTTPEERVALARVAGERLREARAVAIVPMRGWSQHGAEGMPLYDPTGIRALADELEHYIEARRVEAGINDAATSDAAVKAFRELCRERSSLTA